MSSVKTSLALFTLSSVSTKEQLSDIFINIHVQNIY